MAAVDWSFLTSHARVLMCIAHDPGVRLRDIAARLDISERSAYGIVTELTEAGYVVKQKDGRRNRYEIQAHLPLPEPTARERTVGEILALLTGTDPQTGAPMAVPSRPAPEHLSNHQRNTLRQLFQHPAGHNIEWRAVMSLLEAVGSAEERHDGKIAVTIGSETEYFDPPRHKDIDTQAVVNLRRMLADAGYKTAATEPPAESAP
jgi:DNA-binding transcriptional ArsR family regulator